MNRKSTLKKQVNKSKFLDAKEVEKFMCAILSSENVQDSVSQYVANGLVQTSLRGVDSHGIRLFPHYVRALKSGRINGNPNFHFKKTSLTTGVLDADDTFGHAAGMEAVKHVIKMSEVAGSGHVIIKNSTHFGSAAYYALALAEKDLLGWSFTHADSLMLSYNGKRPYLGTNPYCFAAPCKDEPPFCLDMATTNISFNQVKKHREDSIPIPGGFAADKSGKETFDANQAASLFPIGRYKGFGLSMMIEVLCSQLSGMPYGRSIVPMFTAPLEEKRKLGHFISGIRINCFQPVEKFKQRMKEMMDEIRSEPFISDDGPVRVPNDPEKQAFNYRIKNGIPINKIDWDEFSNLANEYDINFSED